MFKSNQKQYDIIYSLGINCACAEYLRKHHLRTKSGPLDWIMSSDIYAPFKTILDEFKIFLEFSYLSADICDDEALNIKCVHTKNQYILVHDFFKDKTISEQENDVKQKYLRRINRLYSDLNSSKRILFCWYGETGIILDTNQLLNYVKEIRAKYKADIDFLFISYASADGATYNEPEQGVILHNLPKKQLIHRQEGNLLWDSENIDKIIKSVHLQTGKKTISSIIRSIFYRVCSVFIFNRTKRHRFVEDKLRNN